MRKPIRASAAFLAALALALSTLSACSPQSQEPSSTPPSPEPISSAAPTPASTQAPASALEAEEGPALAGLACTGSTELAYAKQFAISHFEGGYVLLTVEDGSRYLTVPEGLEAPQGLDEDIVVLRQPLSDVYLTATAAMCFFEALGHGEAIRFSGTQAKDWSVEYAQQAMASGEMVYAGKYREPDYELLTAQGCKLSIQSTMINRVPEAKEKLLELGIPVLVDYSSFEEHPLGRSEWVKFYGALLGEEEQAQALFQEQEALFAKTEGLPATGRTAAYFYFTAEGQPITRPSGDYITKMIEMAGAENLLAHVEGEGKSATVTMEMEDFYTSAKDADVLLYNGDMTGQLESLDQLLALNPLMADFKAVQEGNVWCAKREMFQATLEMGTVVSDFHKAFTGEGKPELLYKLS